MRNWLSPPLETQLIDKLRLVDYFIKFLFLNFTLLHFVFIPCAIGQGSTSSIGSRKSYAFELKYKATIINDSRWLRCLCMHIQPKYIPNENHRYSQSSCTVNDKVISKHVVFNPHSFFFCSVIDCLDEDFVAIALLCSDATNIKCVSCYYFVGTILFFTTRERKIALFEATAVTRFGLRLLVDVFF